LYRFYRLVKQLPGVGPLINMLLRLARSLFWKYRPVGVLQDEPPEEFLRFISDHLNDRSEFTLIEVGAGDGRTLRRLALQYPAARFIGIDIQRAAVLAGIARASALGIKNIDLKCVSCLDDTIEWACDFLISRTSLIYLSREQTEEFFRKRIPKIRQGMLFEEIISLTGQTQRSHFFAHPLPEIIERFSEGNFLANVTFLDYIPWKAESRWSGAKLSFTRIDASKSP